MFQLELPRVLFIASLVVVALGGVLFLTQGQLLPPPFVVSAVLLVLSFVSRRFERPAGMLAMALSLAVPIAVVVEHLRGFLPWFVPIVDVALFSWVFLNALFAVRKTREPEPPSQA